MATKVDQQRLAAEDWRAGLSDEQLKDMLYTLKLCRYFDERMEALYRQGRLPGAIYSGRGRRAPTSASRRRSARTILCSRRTGTCRRS